MKILVLNCGSSSIKFQLIQMQTEAVIAEGIVERIGEQKALYTYKSEVYTIKKKEMPIPNHKDGITHILSDLLHAEHGVLSQIDEIGAVGHRLVHAGEYYSGAVVINDDVLARLKECCILAPLHNPANIIGVEAVKEVMPSMVQCGVFDTAFHQTMPAKAFLYPLPLEYYTQHKIRRYGFHGTSHKYVSQKAADYLQKDISQLKIITCHLGNGASITAIDGGKSVDTSMGLTPLEGVMMGTRSGDIDPAIVVHLVKQLGMTIDEVNNVLNKQSGMLGLSEVSNDMREIENAITKQDPKATQAFDVYVYKIKKYIGAYIAVMNGVDVIIFTGGIGENMALLRSKVLEDMDFFGINIDKEKNKIFDNNILDLSAQNSRVTILKVPTNEELMIALETKTLVETQS